MLHRIGFFANNITLLPCFCAPPDRTTGGGGVTVLRHDRRRDPAGTEKSLRPRRTQRAAAPEPAPKHAQFSLVALPPPLPRPLPSRAWQAHLLSFALPLAPLVLTPRAFCASGFAL